MTSFLSLMPASYQPIQAISPDYSLLPVAEGFNWDDAFAAIETGAWYLVVFRSKHKADADEAYLTMLDQQASGAAMRAPGFMYYFMGVPRADGHCLSFCLWASQEAAVWGSADPAHREAMIKGLPCFEYYDLERYHVRKSAGVVTFEAAQSAGHRPHAHGAQGVVPGHAAAR